MLIRRVVILTGLFLATSASVGAAQEARKPMAQAYWGGSLGLGSLPGPLASNCLPEDSEPAGFLSAWMGAWRGPFGLEVRTSLADTPAFDCTDVGPPLPSEGVHVRKEYPQEVGAISATELRVQVRALPHVRVGVGAGWAAPRNVTYQLLGASVQGASRIRWIVGADVLWFRIPYDRIEEEWRDRRVIRTLGVERTTEWQRSLRVHVGADVLIR